MTQEGLRAVEEALKVYFVVLAKTVEEVKAALEVESN